MENRSKKRAVRRHHRWRLKRKRASYYWWWAGDDAKRLGKVVNTACLCSCSMCGNPRKYKWEAERTIQERKHYPESVDERREE